MNPTSNRFAWRRTLGFVPLLAVPMAAQIAAPPAEDEQVVVLSPFEVSAEVETGYAPATTLAGNRLNTELRDIGNAVSVVTSQFLRDTGAVNNESLLQYTTGTEVGNLQGNFTGVGDSASLSETGRFKNPNSNTRVRGLAAADNTREYFLTDIPWDGYNVDRVDLQRGPNSILFGQGSPAGIINTGLKQAMFKNANEVDLRFGSYGSTRATLDINRVLIEDELAIRVTGLLDNEKFQQEPAFEDDSRIYLAGRWEPRFLKRGSARTILRANFERGEVEANRPRTLPPYDFITPWFATGTYAGGYVYNTTTKQYESTRTYNNLNRETFNPYQLQDDNTGRPNHGQQRPSINGGPNSGQPNPAYQPWIGNFGQSYNGPLAHFNWDGSSVISARTPEARTNSGIGTNGAIDSSIGGFPFGRQGAINRYAAYAYNARLPYSEFGVYKDRSLTDPSVFNFYDNLLDGDNKREWSDFRVYNVSLAQTFMNDKFGFEATYNQENYSDGQLSLLTDTRYAVQIDMMNVYGDGTPLGVNGEPFQDGTANLNVGRPFITDSNQFGNNTLDVEREAARVTAFFTHDFTRDSDPNLLERILGRHTVTGLYAQDSDRRDSRDFQRYAVLDPNYYNLMRLPANTKFTANELAVSSVIYLGPSLLDRTTAAGANIPAPTAEHVVTSGTVRVFDSTWNAPNVNPGDIWWNEYYPDTPENNRPDDPATPANDPGSRRSTQSENPANYVGWVNVPVAITDSEAAPGNRDLLTTGARLQRSRVSSRAFVWQGHLLDSALVGTYGYREDTAKSWSFSRTANNSPGFGLVDLGESYRLPTAPANVLDVTSRSYSIVAHLNELPWVKDWTERLPVMVSLFYNKAENFQPAANRVDIYGDPIAAPAGDTDDRGILIETKDGKFSFRVNRYETKVVNASSSAINGSWFIGSSQAWGGNWANRFEYDLGGDTIQTQGQGNPGSWTYSPAPGEDQAAADAREAAAIAAWRAWQAQVDPRFYAAWGINLNDMTKPITATEPQGLAVTEDATSKGWEFELNASPLRNWRVTFNASRTEAVRENIGGAALTEFVSAYQNALNNTAAGDLRIWWGGAGNETTKFQWNNNVGSNYAQRKLQEGTNVPELREWRFNLITNYDFTEGLLKGFNAGLGVRWQDEVVIGYAPMRGATANDISFDLANPYYGPQETNIDFWIGYGRKLTEKIDWRVQLNVRNAFEGDDLIPITTQPDGTPAAYRIAPSQIWSVSNTFRF